MSLRAQVEQPQSGVHLHLKLNVKRSASSAGVETKRSNLLINWGCFTKARNDM